MSDLDDESQNSRDNSFKTRAKIVKRESIQTRSKAKAKAASNEEVPLKSSSSSDSNKNISLSATSSNSAIFNATKQSVTVHPQALDEPQSVSMTLDNPGSVVEPENVNRTIQTELIVPNSLQSPETFIKYLFMAWVPKKIPTIPMLGTGESCEPWIFWSRRCRAALEEGDCWFDPSKHTLTTIAADENLARKNVHAGNFIARSVDIRNLAVLPTEPCFHTYWNKLSQLHKAHTATTVDEVISKLVNMKYVDGTPITDHLLDLQQEFQRLSNIGKSLGEEANVGFVLASLSGSRFSNIAESAKLLVGEELTVQKLSSTLCSMAANDSNIASAMPVAANSNITSRLGPKQSKERFCQPCRSKSHHYSQCWTHNPNVTKPQNRFMNRSKRTNNKQTPRNNTQSGRSAESSEKSNVDESSHVDNELSFLGSTGAYASKSGNIQPWKFDRKRSRDSESDDDLSKPKLFEKQCFININKRFTQEMDCKSAHGQKIGANTRSNNCKLTQNMNLNKRNLAMNCDINELQNENSSHSDRRPKHSHSNTWLIDSGASIHMTNNRNMLKNFLVVNDRFVTIANGSQIPIVGTGDVGIKLNSLSENKEITLRQVAFVPDLDINLLSVRKLTSSGANVIFTKQSCFVKENNNVLKIGSAKGSQFTLNCANVAHEKCSLCIHQWHRLLAHRNLRDLMRLKSRGIIFKKCKCPVDCIACLKGKMSRQPFPKQSEKPSEVLDVVVSDLCGGGNIVPTTGGATYFISFVDVHSGYIEVELLKHKHEAINAIMNYVTRVENIQKKSLKFFRSDRGGEYLNEKLKSFFASRGTQQQFTVHDCPEQNGVAERLNRTIIEATRTLLAQYNLNKNLWGEAVKHVVYTLNRFIKEDSNLTPVEIFTNHKLELKFYEFGHPVFYATPPANRKKLDDRGQPGIFLGVDNTSKGFRILSKDNKIRVERHVRFLKSENVLSESIEYTPPFTNAEPLAQKPSDSKTLESSSQNQNDESESLGDPSAILESNLSDPDVVNLPRRSERLRLKQSANAAFDDPFFEPSTYNQAIKCKNKEKWIDAMKEEINSINLSQTWSVVEHPKDRTAIGSRWVFKIKKNDKGEIERFKARLVAQGFTQRYGVDYDEVFAPVARSATFRALLSVASAKNLVVKQYDVKTAFLNGTLQEEIFMKPPQGYNLNNKVLKLHKSLYGLKQAARVWNQTLHKALCSLGFKQSLHDDCLYILRKENSLCFMICHVDDIIFAANSENLITSLSSSLSKNFELKCLGAVQNFLAIQITRDDLGVFSISQTNYIMKIAQEFELQDSKGSKYPLDPGYHKLQDDNMLETNTIYRKLIGMLLYVSTNTRPDISASVAILAQRVSKPRKLDLTEALRVVRYLVATKDLKLKLFDKSKPPLIAFSDSDWAEDRTSRKSISGVLCQVFGGSISWSSRKQDVVSISTTEAEFYALAETIKEVIWLKGILIDLGIKVESPITVNSDNQSTIMMINNPKSSSRTKHIDVRLHFVRDYVYCNKIKLKYCPTDVNTADMLTKPLAGIKIKQHREGALLIDPNY